MRAACNELARVLHAVGQRADAVGTMARRALGVLGRVGEGPGVAGALVGRLRELEALVGRGGGLVARYVVVNGGEVEGYLPFVE